MTVRDPARRFGRAKGVAHPLSVALVFVLVVALIEAWLSSLGHEPGPGSCWRHSITSSARSSSVGGTIRPSALAVLRLIRSSNLVGCSTGRSAGFAPLRILSINAPARRYKVGTFGP